VLALLAPAVARADAPPPPATPTIFVAIDNRNAALKVPALQSAFKAALSALPSGFSLCLVGGSPLEASPPLSPKDPRKVLAEVARAAKATPGGSSEIAILSYATREWTGPYGSSSPRHHLVLVSGVAGGASLAGASLGLAVRKGFTVSLLSLAKAEPKALKDFVAKSAGRAKVVSARTLAAALRAELAWGKLSKADEKKLATARSTGVLRILGSSGRGGLIGVLGTGGSGGSGGSGLGGAVSGTLGGGGVGVGGLGLRGRGPGYGYGSSSHLRRGEALVGQKLALAFRAVTCAGGCDVAEVRRSWLASAGPLLGCLEGSLSLGYGEVSVELGANGKTTGSGAAASCASSWYGRQARRGVSARLLVGPASSVR
jgi:hypothetical protein